MLRTNLDSMFDMSKQVIEDMLALGWSPHRQHLPGQRPVRRVRSGGPLIPAGRLGELNDVARLVAFLASPGAPFITGANIAIDRGQHMS